MKKIKQEVHTEDISETILSLAQSVQAVHEGYKGLELALSVIIENLSIPVPEFMKKLDEKKGQFFDKSFLDTLNENMIRLSPGEAIQENDVVVVSVFDENKERMAIREIVQVGQEFLGEKVEANFKVGDTVQFSKGFFETILAVRMI